LRGETGQEPPGVDARVFLLLQGFSSLDIKISPGVIPARFLDSPLPFAYTSGTNTGVAKYDEKVEGLRFKAKKRALKN